MKTEECTKLEVQSLEQMPPTSAAFGVEFLTLLRPSLSEHACRVHAGMGTSGTEEEFRGTEFGVSGTGFSLDSIGCGVFLGWWEAGSVRGRRWCDEVSFVTSGSQ